ncbi:DMT family transporter [Glaciecola sp. 1036]|uniref:DMT family transporter n=1 Tax=Alteromonadaceae TaxID=72275 RepID=UPI003D009853
MQIFSSNTFLFAICTLIWGSTWIAITFQVNETALMFSVGLRFGIAAMLMGFWCLIARKTLKITFKQHLLMGTAGIFLYTLDYTFLYAAQQHIVSALLAVLSSAMIYFNVVLRRIFLKKPIRLDVVAGATLGLIGIVLIFSPEFEGMSTNQGLAIGLLFSLGSFLSASIGNVLSEKILDKDTSVLQLNFWAMTYGVICTFIVLGLSGSQIIMPDKPSYYIALIYLAIFGSIIAFGAYMRLLKQIGSDKSAYVVLLYPIVALAVSTVFEGYIWTLSSILGVIIVLFGNAIAMGKLNRLFHRFA